MMRQSTLGSLRALLTLRRIHDVFRFGIDYLPDAVDWLPGGDPRKLRL